ncbi:MAG: hypothetical protein WBI07_00820, partial [Mobilitalea sp.]
MKSRLHKTTKNLVMTLAMPVIVYVFFKIICTMNGAMGFGVDSDLNNIILNTIYTGMIALAVSYNLTSGRFDFSVGSVLILSIIVGASVAKAFDVGPMGMLAVTVLVGALLGTISGLVYVWLRLPPMIVSLGVAMVYEAIAYRFNDGTGVKLIGRRDLLIYAKQPYNIIILAVVLAVLIFILNYTKFGYNTNSLRSGQQITVNVGVNEKVNAVKCYMIAGILLGIAGVIYISQYGSIAPSTGLSSSSFIMGAFLPIFIGGAIGKYSDRNVGVIIGAFVQATITAGFAKLGLSSSLQLVLNGVIVM